MPTDNQIVTIELRADDAYRLLWLVQRQSVSPVYSEYWLNLADHIQANIEMDLRQHETLQTTDKPG